MALSDLLGPSLQLGATILSVGSALSKAQASRAIGIRRQAASEFEAGQLDQEAQMARGIGMRGQQYEGIKTGLVMSKQLALAAASGAGASDPTIVDIISRTAGEGSYRQALAMYQGESQARLDMMRAAAARFEGRTSMLDTEAASEAQRGAALSTVLAGTAKLNAMSEKGGYGTMFEKYWSGPKNGGGYQSPTGGSDGYGGYGGGFYDYGSGGY